MAKIIGITGGIGSGKTTLIEYLKSLGYFVYVSDNEAKNLLNSKEIINKVQFLFKKHVLILDGVLDRKKLAEIVFADPEQLQKLNNLIHPLVKEHFDNWTKQHENESLLFKESAILFESGAYKACDYTILITAPEALRIARVMQRDGVSEENVKERMNNQWSDQQKAQFSDYIIENIDLEAAKQEIINVINKIG
ncbi:dephospho-CoA kinase [Flavobacterium agricola]|uniref:Dephospho-CoA kinase n=1 Tax=Flavobacterium agricola TaxID=2870839 RepID=A0ABY6M330_9FLAO|nr:dephospho-CoA kinase [Flavobacterium agricola]UYW01855.1 dephospho-CoA kinase [Flavobacterium agricola]